MAQEFPLLHPKIATALEPGQPGRLVKRLARFVPGVGETGRQIGDYSAYWRDQAEAALGADPHTLQLVALGDSLAQGIGASQPQLGYVGLVQHWLSDQLDQPVGVVNLSRSGAVIDDVVNIQLPALAALPARSGPRLVLCTIGNNDLMAGARPKTVARRFGELAPQLPASTVVATLPAAGSVGVKFLNRAIREHLTAQKLGNADVGYALKTWRGNTAGDRFHPNDQGYRLWADTFTSAIDLDATGASN